jgi:nucleotide-binding universal stress UspA family protein
MTETTARRRIVVGVDSSDSAARAAHWAAREAIDRGVILHLVHALDFPAPAGMIVPIGYVQSAYKTAEELLELLAEKLRLQRPELTVTTEVSEQSASDALVSLSRTAQLVVTGKRGRGGLAGLLHGSVGLKSAAHAHCPAVVVRGAGGGEPSNEIVLGVGRREPEAPIRFAFATASALGAVLYVVRAAGPSIPRGGHHNAASREAEEADDVTSLIKAARETQPDVAVATRIVRDSAVSGLIGAARGARLVVVGARRHRSPMSVGAGHVVHGLLSHSPTPVAVVPIV